MKEELITIIIPVYNVEKYIDRCLNTIINQTYKNLEIILVDDGSRDNSGYICDYYAKRDNRIKVIHKENEGLGLTRNIGIKNAKGKYIAFVDSDDYIELNTYKTLYENLKNNKVDAVACNFKRLKKDNTVEYNCSKFINQVYEEERINNELIPIICGNPKYNFVIGSVCNILYKKEIIDEYNIEFLNEREYVSEDIIFNYIYFSKCKKVQFLKENLYIYCENQGSLTKKYNPTKIEKFRNLYYFIKNKINMNKEESYFGLDTQYIGYMRVAIIQEVRLNPNKELINKNIKSICNDDLLCEILKKYDVKYLTYKQKIFTILMKYKMSSLLKFVVKI